MGDSDDEFDRRRGGRDKFRRERNDYEGRRGEDRRGGRDGGWEDRGRESWGNRNRDRRDSYGDRGYERGRRDRYSPHRHDISPPMKRMRREWDDGGGGGGFAPPDMPYGGSGGGGGGGGSGPMRGGPPGGAAGSGNWGSGPADMGPPQQGFFGRGEHDAPTQPPMMTFKSFLVKQDDNISDEDAIKKYSEYKMDFRKQQINDFFLNHKDEEWFKYKYHPEECGKRKEECTMALKRRCDVYMKLLDLAYIDAVTMDTSRTEDLIKLLDAGVILMEGGTDFDLKILEEEPRVEEDAHHQEPNHTKPSKDQESKKEDGEMDDDEKSEGEASLDGNQDQIDKRPDSQEKKQKRYRNNKDDYGFNSGSDSDSGSLSDSDDGHTKGIDPSEPNVENSKGEETGKDEKRSEDKIPEKGEVTNVKDEEEGEHSDEAKPRALHKTLSIFLRNLAPTINKQEVESLCKRYPGYLRVALQDPQPERRFFRRGWVTFDRKVNIKEICWNLNNIRLRDCEMGAIVNRELKQRVRPINGIVMHKTIAKQDIKHCAKIITNLDHRWGLWSDSDEEKRDQTKDEADNVSFGFVSKNPVLKNITDYLVDEGSYEEEALMGESVDDKTKESSEVGVERDEALLKVLDRMILYLRIVHSFDYYSGVEYPNEDEMPHRCGIMHARGIAPPNRLAPSDFVDWMNGFEHKVLPFLNLKVQLDKEEAKKLGKKDPESEVEKFVQANTQEVAKDKWLCPMSGKKFKGPEFVRKHLFNKHAEKVDEVRKEVSFFNNYLLDPKRPMLPEHPANRQMSAPQQNNFNLNQGGNSGGAGSGGGGSGYGGGPPPGYRGGYNNHRGGYNMGFDGGRGHRRGYNNYHGGYRGGGGGNFRQDFRQPNDRIGNRRDRSRADPRGIIEYRDLDAPEDSDMF